MNVLKKSIILGGCVAALTLGAGNHLMAQGRDPAQMRQDRLDRLHEQLEFTNAQDWNAIEPIVGKVLDAERDVFSMRMGGMFGGGRGGRRGGGEANNPNGGSDQQRPRRPNFFGEPSATVTALRDAIEAKAPVAELKAKLAAVRAETKAKEAKLEAAQEELRGYLTTRQEAIAVANGLLR
jgi:Tfp pilus assembly protein FimV